MLPPILGELFRLLPSSVDKQLSPRTTLIRPTLVRQVQLGLQALPSNERGQPASIIRIAAPLASAMNKWDTTDPDYMCWRVYTNPFIWFIQSMIALASCILIVSIYNFLLHSPIFLRWTTAAGRHNCAPVVIYLAEDDSAPPVIKGTIVLPIRSIMRLLPQGDTEARAPPTENIQMAQMSATATPDVIQIQTTQMQRI